MADKGGLQSSWVTVEKKKEQKKEPEPTNPPSRGRGRGTGGRGRGRPSRGNQNTQVVAQEQVIEEKQQTGSGGVVKIYNWNEKSNTAGFSYADIAKKSPPKNAWSKPPTQSSPPPPQTQTHKKAEVTFESNDDENDYPSNKDWGSSAQREWGQEETANTDNTSDWSRQANAPETHSEVSLEQEAENAENQQEIVEQPVRPSSPPAPPKQIYETSPKKPNNKRKEVKKKVKAPSSSVVLPSYLQTRCNDVYSFNAPEKIEDSKDEPQFNWETTQPPTPPAVQSHSPTILRSPQSHPKTHTTPQRPVVEQTYAQIASTNSNVIPSTNSWAAPGPQTTQTTTSFQQNTTQYGQFPQADSGNSYADAFAGFSGRVSSQAQGTTGIVYPLAPGLSTQQSDNKQTQQRNLYQPQQISQPTLQPATQHQNIQPLTTSQTQQQQPQAQAQAQTQQPNPQTVAQQYQQQMAYMNMYAPHMYGLYGMYGMQPMGGQSYDVDYRGNPSMYNMGMNYYGYPQQYAMPYAPRPNWPVSGYTGAVDAHQRYNAKAGANRNAPQKYSNQQGDLGRKY